MDKDTRNKKIEIQDNISNEQIRQLHSTVLGFSNQSFEIKKICTSIEITAFTLLTTIFKDNYSDPMFVRGVRILSIIVPVLFYLVDISLYYYQDKLRAVIVQEQNNIRKRHNIDINNEQRFLNPKWNIKRVFRSVFNGSYIIYLCLITCAIIVPIIFK